MSWTALLAAHTLLQNGLDYTLDVLLYMQTVGTDFGYITEAMNCMYPTYVGICQLFQLVRHPKNLCSFEQRWSFMCMRVRRLQTCEQNMLEPSPSYAFHGAYRHNLAVTSAIRRINHMLEFRSEFCCDFVSSSKSSNAREIAKTNSCMKLCERMRQECTTADQCVGMCVCACVRVDDGHVLNNNKIMTLRTFTEFRRNDKAISFNGFAYGERRTCTHSSPSTVESADQKCVIISLICSTSHNRL